MRLIAVSLALVLAAPSLVSAQPKKPAVEAGPKELGKFDDWIAATHQESGRKSCYAFVLAKNSVPALAGRGEVLLTVTERATGRDWVAITAGFTFRKDAAVTLQVDTAGLDFYTAQQQRLRPRRQGSRSPHSRKGSRRWHGRRDPARAR